MVEQTTVIKIKDKDQLFIPKRTLTADSPMFEYLLGELNIEKHEIDDFTRPVFLFVYILENRHLNSIEDSMFRELYDLATVFEVQWLKERCCSWLRGKMDSATESKEKTFLYEESWYILKKWGEKGEMDVLISKFVVQDNASLI